MPNKPTHRLVLGLSAAMVLALSSAAVTAPAQAAGDGAAARDVLEVEVRPAIATPSGVVTVAAEYDARHRAGGSGDDSEDSGDDSDDDSEDSGDDSGDAADDSDGAGGSGDDPGAPAPVSTLKAPATGAVALSVDFGDGSAPEAMRVVGSAATPKAFGKHRYTTAGTFTVTVTATPSTGTPISVPVQVQVGRGSARLAGADRFETANRLAREDFPTDGEAGAVLLARSDGFADALAAAPAALLAEAPVLLTPTADLPDSVHREIARALGASGKVYVLGGEGAVSPAVVTELEASGYEVVRIAGRDRVETALLLARFLVDSGARVDEVVLTGSLNFPDALSGAAFAASTDAPVLLTAPGALDPRVAAFLAQLGPVRVLVTGGTSSVGDTVVAELTAAGHRVERLAGADRYETSAEVATELFPAATTVVLATGRNFPDALAGAPAAGRRGAPVLLVGTELAPSVREYLRAGAGRIEAVYVLGGEGTVPAGVLSEVDAILGS
ncbi:putative cell wall-binding protein [Kineococcus radiotolerans]|uniref:Putative cell wall-binding protein n=1 Tax=Kineococcus radiotolerans TaxID=131568 RepID=A0A7W4TNL1_KINRA|nr:cell wall-binding repeat-containing protein [Kineococcus radiotolerans]MBB2901858.1 putative cell wall-binding protein [Kineococcus radiotolerans]